MAVIVTEESKHKAGGGAPIFVARDAAEQQELALYLTRILNAMAHDLENGVMVLVRHS
ncbi:MAG: hypothetical protein PWP65_1203 [Clostridia bacterium]|nr:hypothetical protein [Clostridia bacterium]